MTASRQVSRRTLMLAGAAGAASTIGAGAAHASRWIAGRGADGALAFAAAPPAPVDFFAHLDAPVILRSVERYRTREHGVILHRVVSQDGVEGVVRGSVKADRIRSYFDEFVYPRLIGADARDILAIVEKAYMRDYEFAGLPYWSAWGEVELAIWDLIGKTAGARCVDMMGGALRDTIPIYASSNRRTTTPEEEVAHLQEAVAAIGARALKVKIGGRMNRNTDAMPGRTEALIALVRKTFGDDMTIYADANGGYDAPTAVRVCQMLYDHGVDLLEEPCPFEDFEMTAAVAEATPLKLAGGEQDYALEKWRWYIERRVFDVVQPDLTYSGGMMRAMTVQRMAAAAGLGVAPHFPRNNADSLPMMHLAAASPNLYGFQEYRSRPRALDYDHTPEITPENGTLALPPGPGWGVRVAPETWTDAERVGAADA